jgi:hypothetical protein
VDDSCEHCNSSSFIKCRDIVERLAAFQKGLSSTELAYKCCRLVFLCPRMDEKKLIDIIVYSNNNSNSNNKVVSPSCYVPKREYLCELLCVLGCLHPVAYIRSSSGVSI